MDDIYPEEISTSYRNIRTLKFSPSQLSFQHTVLAAIYERSAGLCEMEDGHEDVEYNDLLSVVEVSRVSRCRR